MQISMQVYFMYVKMWHYTTRTHSHMYSLILCMHVCMYAMPCHAMHVCMLEHVGTCWNTCMFSIVQPYAHEVYVCVWGAKCNRWWILIHDHHHSVVWTRKTRRRGSAPTIWGLCSNSLSIFIFRYRTLLRFPKNGTMLPIESNACSVLMVLM